MLASKLDRLRDKMRTATNYGAKVRRELEDDIRVFYVTAWGYAADHYFGWLPKALNVHPEIFALLAHEGSRPKYLKERTRAQRPPLVPFTEFLNDMGMTYQAIGDCYSYRAGQMPELLKDPQYSDIPVANLVRHPIVWLQFYIRWRAGNMCMRAGATDPLAWEWKVAHHGTFRHLGLKAYDKEDVEVWAAFQGMTQLNNVLGDLPAVKRHIPVERLVSDRKAFVGLVEYLTKGRCVYDRRDLRRVYAMAETLFRGEEPVETNPRSIVESWEGWKADAFRALLTPAALDAYKSFGYDLLGLDEPAPVSLPKPTSGPAQAIFVSSPMKSGTWLLRAVLEELTGLSAYEPPIGAGTPAYDDEMLIEIPPGTFFSWHSILNDRSTALLKGAATKNIFLVRNIYDVIVSMYNHLVKDPDAAIGRSVGGSEYLVGRSPEVALSMMIAGFTSQQLTWDGIALHVRHIASFLRFQEEGGDALMLTYDELTHDKASAIRKIAQYLGMSINEGRIAEIVEATSFHAMKSIAKEVGTERHFTDAKDRDLKKAIQSHHIAMVDRIVMEEIPDVKERLERAKVPTLFEYRATVTHHGETE